MLVLKKASLGIAMQSGSGVARDVADMILLNDSFGVLRPAFREGRRIIGRNLPNALGTVAMKMHKPTQPYS